MEERCGKKRKEGNDENEKEEEKASPSHFERIPPEVVLKVLSQLKGKTLMVSIPQVCKLWRAVCHDIKNVHLDFSWWKGREVPVEVLVGWRQTPFMLGAGIDVGAGGSSTARVEESRGWKTSLCELFPRTTSVTMGGRNNVEDAHMMALADKCPGITHADFTACGKLTDAAVIALADKCPGITHTDCSG